MSCPSTTPIAASSGPDEGVRARTALWWALVAALLWLSDCDRLRGGRVARVVGCQGAGGAGAQPKFATRSQLRPLTSVWAIANVLPSGNAAAATGSSAMP